MLSNHSPVKNYIISLELLMKRDNDAIQKVNESLETRGYAFIRLSRDLVSEIDNCLLPIESFFGSSSQYKKTFFKAPIFGHFAVKHKESFRILTGNRLNEQSYPQNFGDIKKLVQKADKIMYAVSQPLFPHIIGNAKKLDIPFFDVLSKNGQWGMFDIAKYHNDGTRVELNCKEHYDPGLLSLSLRSTEPGLELKDEFGKWIKAPHDKTIAVLWVGKAGTIANPKFKPGVHRVVNPKIPGRPRIAIWHEICTSAQEHRELLEKKLAKNIQNSTGIPMSKVRSNPPYIATKSESTTGIPMSKSAPIPPDVARFYENERKLKERYRKPMPFESLLR